MIYFTESHEWIKVKDHIGTVGITRYAQQELGEIVHIELPKIGQMVKMGQEIAVLESTKAAADIYAPVAGTIIAINDSLKAHPSAINHHAETTAWLFQIQLSHPQDLKNLLSQEQYNAIIS